MVKGFILQSCVASYILQCMVKGLCLAGLQYSRLHRDIPELTCCLQCHLHSLEVSDVAGTSSYLNCMVAAFNRSETALWYVYTAVTFCMILSRSPQLLSFPATSSAWKISAKKTSTAFSLLCMEVHRGKICVNLKLKQVAIGRRHVVGGAEFIPSGPGRAMG